MKIEPAAAGRPVRPLVPLLALLALLPAAALPAPPPAGAAASTGAVELPVPPGYEPLEALMSERGRERRRAARQVAESGDRSLVPGLVDALFFAPGRARGDLFESLEKLTGAELERRYYTWVEWLGAHPEIVPREGYEEWKLLLLARIDRRFAKVLFAGVPSRIRLEEVVWGGVTLDGIPSLDNPRSIPASEAGYLGEEERVFGVSLGGEHRAYPLRILSWHEMANDVVGGEPVTLSFCTLCGSGILYSTRTPNGGAYSFGTSGLLYRSNKLMLDRQSHSLWSNLTGEPVVGRLAATSVRLEMLPMTLTTWGEWRRRHPETTVLALDRETARRFGFDYRPGAADRARAGVAFPVWPKDGRLPRDEEVYALRLGAAAKAFPVRAVLAEGVVNDRLGETGLVLVGDPAGGAVRAYRRDGLSFRPGGRAGELLDGAGRRWRPAEDALYPVGHEADPLPRQPGHVALWFGWYGFYPHTELYRGGG